MHPEKKRKSEEGGSLKEDVTTKSRETSAHSGKRPTPVPAPASSPDVRPDRLPSSTVCEGPPLTPPEPRPLPQPTGSTPRGCSRKSTLGGV